MPTEEELTSVPWKKAVGIGAGVFEWRNDEVVNGWIALGQKNILYTRFGKPGQQFSWALSSRAAEETVLFLHFGGVHHVCVIDPWTLVFKVVERNYGGGTDQPFNTTGAPNPRIAVDSEGTFAMNIWQDTDHDAQADMDQKVRWYDSKAFAYAPEETS